MFNQKPIFGEDILDSGNALTRGLVGCWLMNEGTGDIVVDLSGFDNKGIFTNSPSWSIGEVGQGILFTDGVNEYIDCGDKTEFDLTTALSIFSIAEFDSKSDVRSLVSKGAGGVSTHAWDVKYHTSPDALRCSLRTTSAQTNIDGATSPNLNEIYSIGMGWSQASGTCQIYLNGLQDGTGSFAGPIQTNTKKVMVGSFDGWSASGEMAGKIYLTYLWNRKLTASEQLSLYINPYQIFDTGLNPAIFGGLVAPSTTIPVIMHHLRQQGIA